jgi:hypothetical protein
MHLTWTEVSQAHFTLNNVFYVGESYRFELFLNDTYHLCGVTNASIDVNVAGSLPAAAISVVEDTNRPGYYLVTVSGLYPSQGLVTFRVTKEGYSTTEFQQGVVLENNPMVNMMLNAGVVLAVILIFVVAVWLLWNRIYSIPWEVRRLRKMAKGVGSEGTFELSEKDRKRFRLRESVLSSSVGRVFQAVDIPVPPAIIPTTADVQEIGSTEEDIMLELDKILGLGAEEKAILAKEMMKIPRTDRVWFLDDLRRQMEERRMDFLTRQPKPPTEAPDTAPTTPPGEPELLPEIKELTEPVAPLEPAPPVDPLEPVTPTTPWTEAEVGIPPEPHPPTETEPGPAPVESPIEVEIREELDKIAGLSEEEKAVLEEELKHLSKKEREELYQSLRENP